MRTVTLLLALAAVAGADPRDLANFHRAVTTSSPEAQKAFDQGLALVYGFDHEAAIAAFKRAAGLDPECAMAFWGEALAHGPNINNPVMEEAASKAAFEAVAKAQALMGGAGALEQALISALAKRYAWPAPEDRAPLDQAYADAMREVWRAHPKDADVGALFAESLLDLRPWDQWTKDGKAQPGTEETVATLEAVLKLAPMHPGANHYYIHTMEASPWPEKALPSADRLRDLVNSTSHLVHMPAHIDIRLGRYRAAVRANQKAVGIDEAGLKEGKGLGFYTLYRTHNYHFLAYAGMFDGESAVAMRAARQMVEVVPDELVKKHPDFLEGFLGAPYCVLVRFGKWDEILAEPPPPAGRPASASFYHYARGAALATLGRVDEALAAQQAFEAARATVPESATIGNNKVRDVLAVGAALLAGEIEFRRGNHDRGFELLREGVKLDDALRYDEPWGWMMPVRHALGALLLEQGRLKEAEEVYRADLVRHPANGWALHGLAECLRRASRMDEAAQVEAQLKEAWQHADFPLKASCFCRRS